MKSIQNSSSRRDFIKTSGQSAALSVLANVAMPPVHAAGSDLIQVALVGCGGRGGGAAANALAVKRGPVKLVAMADRKSTRLNSSHVEISYAVFCLKKKKKKKNKIKKKKEKNDIITTATRNR